jgi:hypothetical protein
VSHLSAYSQALVYLKETGRISELLDKYKIGMSSLADADGPDARG